MNPKSTRQFQSTSQPGLKQKVNFNNRVTTLKLVVALLAVVLLGRLFYLQVIRHQHYNALALSEHQKKFAIPATRGNIYFRDGNEIVPAVLNAKVYTLYADPKEIADPEATARIILSQLPLERDSLLKQLKKKNTSYVVLEKRLSREQVDKLFSQKNKLRGVNVVAVPQRVYPEGGLGAQLLGFVNDEGVGQYGVEGALNDQLQGNAGLLRAVTDVNGVPLSLDDATNIARQPKNGSNKVLTVDRNIQAKAEEALNAGLQKFGATKGSVVVLDPNSGAVRAMANVPSYEPAKYFDVTSEAYERFRNRIVSDPYEAGSVMKVMTMAAGINEGVVNRNSRYNNTDSVRVEDTTIKNALRVPGSRTMQDVLQNSLNTGVVHVLSQLGGGSVNRQARDRLYSYFDGKYGFGHSTGIEQTGETPGTIFSPDDEQGNNVRYANMSFGQGMDVTMIQTVAAFSAIVNNGAYYQPHVIEGERGVDGSLQNPAPTPIKSTIVSADTSGQIREMIRGALNEAPAVARLVRPGYNVGGKSGTSQIIDPRTGKYIDTNAIGTYIGFGGDNLPRYVIMVRVDDAKLGSADYAGSVVAAPIFAEINNWLIDYYNVAPL